MKYSRKLKGYGELMKYSVLKAFYEEMAKECGYEALLYAIHGDKTARTQAVHQMKRLNRLSTGLHLSEH